MTPIIANTITDVRQEVHKARQLGRTVGLVPTMGALHAGHISLIRAARNETGFVVVSIFVNPTQFGPNEDFQRYPRPFETDLKACAQESVDLIFAPELKEIYPPGFRTFVEVTQLQDGLCGRSRPGHFRGVATVVLKLFNIVQPDIAYFGQKDGQQARIVQQLVKDVNLPLEVRVCPIVREADGLALSSRNQYLNAEQRRQATALNRALGKVRQAVESGERDVGRLKQLLVQEIAACPGAVLDYAELVDAADIQPLGRIQGETLVALAVRFGGTRLIDNILVKPPW